MVEIEAGGLPQHLLGIRLLASLLVHKRRNSVRISAVFFNIVYILCVSISGRKLILLPSRTPFRKPKFFTLPKRLSKNLF